MYICIIPYKYGTGDQTSSSPVDVAKGDWARTRTAESEIVVQNFDIRSIAW